MHLIKLSDKGGGDPMHRTYEQQISTMADIRVLVAHLQCELQKANREGRELFVELWSDYKEPPLEASCHSCKSAHPAESFVT